jgi:murein endopeptidase
MDDASDIDWNATWGLISALGATGEVQYIFLSHSRQKHLYEAAKKAGVKKDELARIIQYPNKSKTNNGIVRHAKGHDVHIHVRFSCASNETKCESY